jgi:Fe-S cluster biosynthesis and repair protein YggX
MASEARRYKRLQERQSKKFYEKIRIETLNKLKTMNPEDRAVLEQEYKEFLKNKNI